MLLDIARTSDLSGEREAAAAFVRHLDGTYQVSEVILFGSRARADHRPDSDVDIAVVLQGQSGNFLNTKLHMAGIAFDVLMETGLLVQPLPLWNGDLENPARCSNPRLISAIIQEGIRIL